MGHYISKRLRLGVSTTAPSGLVQCAVKATAIIGILFAALEQVLKILLYSPHIFERLLELDQFFFHDDLHTATRLRRFGIEVEKLANFPQCEADFFRLANEAQAMRRCVVVIAVAGLPTSWLVKEPLAFVVAYGLGGDPTHFGKFRNFHNLLIIILTL